MVWRECSESAARVRRALLCNGVTSERKRRKQRRELHSATDATIFSINTRSGSSINMAVVIPPDRFLELGLEMVGYDKHDKEGRILFLAFYNATPESCSAMFADLQTTNIPEAHVADPCYQCFLKALYWFTNYHSDRAMKELLGKRVLSRAWYYTKKIQALKDPQIGWVRPPAARALQPTAGIGFTLENGWRALASPLYHGFVRARHESFCSRIKLFSALDRPFRHGARKHKAVFEAVCVIVQYDMENGRPLWLVE